MVSDDDDWEEITAVEHSPRELSVADVASALRRGAHVREWDFDRFLPPDLRRVSSWHWTPLFVACRVTQWLDSLGVRDVVDIGSGAGKFCVAAALAGHSRFVGIEQRPRLVRAARRLAGLFGVEDRVRFVEHTFPAARAPDADAYYLYNPFGENLFGRRGHIDEDVELGEDRYERDVMLTEQFLARVRVGTYVVKYNGFGGDMPASYAPIRIDRRMPNTLRMWQKTGDRAG